MQFILILIGVVVGGWVVWFWLAAGGKNRYQNPSFTDKHFLFS